MAEDAPDNVRSIADRAANGEDEDVQPEMFPMGSLEGDQKSLRAIFKSGLPVETTVALMAAEVPVRGGLMDFDRAGQVIVSYEPHKVEVIAKRENDKVIGYKVRQKLRPSYVEAVESVVPDAANG